MMSQIKARAAGGGEMRVQRFLSKRSMREGKRNDAIWAWLNFQKSGLAEIACLEHLSRAHSAAMSRPVARVSLWLVLE